MGNWYCNSWKLAYITIDLLLITYINYNIFYATMNIQEHQVLTRPLLQNSTFVKVSTSCYSYRQHILCYNGQERHINRWEIIVHPWTGLTIMLRVKFGLYNCICVGDEKLVSVASNCTLSQCDLHVDFVTIYGKTFKWENFYS